MGPGVVVWGIAFAAVAAAVVALADRWAAALDEAPDRAGGSPARERAGWFVAAFAAGAWLGGRDAAIVATVWALAIGATLLLVALIDLRTKLIPIAAVAGVLVVGVARAATEGAFVASLIGALVAAAVFALLWAVALPLRARAGTTPFGLGDVLLATAIGAVVGWPTVLATLFLGAVFGAVASIWLLVSRSARATDAIPYGVFLSAAALVAEFARL